MKKGSMAIVLAALLVATIVGVVWARPNQAAEGVLRKITIPAGHFGPNADGLDWYNNGRYVESSSGWVVLVAPVIFPCVERVTVKKVTISASDANGSQNACAGLYRSSPTSGTEVQIASACTAGSGGAGNWSDDTISPSTVKPSQGPYIWLNIDGTGIQVYGVTIEYRRQM